MSTRTPIPEVDQLGTNRARLGYAWDRFLMFATAGIAFGKVEGTIENAGFLTGSKCAFWGHIRWWR
jgi:outer membrane immunogenic protein